MEERLRPWFYLEVVLGAAAAAVFVITLMWTDWIELVFKVDPDAGNGSLEKAVFVVLAVAAIGCAWLARTEWQRAHAPAGQVIR